MDSALSDSMLVKLLGAGSDVSYGQMVAHVRTSYAEMLETVFEWGVSRDSLRKYHAGFRKMSINVLSGPRQGRGSDCGVYLLAIAEALMRNIPPKIYFQWPKTLTPFRMRLGIALSIAANEIPGPIWDYETDAAAGGTVERRVTT